MVLDSILLQAFDFQILNFDWSKNVIIFGVGIISTVNSDDRKKDILVTDKRPMQELEDWTIMQKQ